MHNLKKIHSQPFNFHCADIKIKILCCEQVNRKCIDRCLVQTVFTQYCYMSTIVSPGQPGIVISKGDMHPRVLLL